MHQERYVSTTKMCVCALWVLVASLMLAAWVLAFAGDAYGRWAALLAFTACALAPAAGVAHLKVYALKITGLIRITAGMQVDPPTREDKGLHSVR